MIRIHLHSRQGIYTVVKTNYDSETITITCNRWNALADYPKELVTKDVPVTDFKCMAGLPGAKKRRAKLQAEKEQLLNILILKEVMSKICLN